VLKLTTIGTSVGVILPKEASARLKVDKDKGDSIFLTEQKDGFRVTPFDPQFEKTMESARKVNKRRRNVLRELAK
jgi:putative addiction module antidote